MQSPPEDKRVTPRLPPGYEFRKRVGFTTDPFADRQVLGAQSFTVSGASTASIAGTAKKQLEVGQILEFSDSAAESVDPMPVASQTVIQHDLNALDYASLGLTADDQAHLEDLAARTLNNLNGQLNDLRIRRTTVEIAINENKKAQNETIKAITAIKELVSEDPTLAGMVVILEDKLAGLQASMTELISQADALAAEAVSVLDRCRGVCPLVR